MPKNISFSDGRTALHRLVVVNDYARGGPTTSRLAFRLYWQNIAQDNLVVGAEGECSAVYHAREMDAIAYGKRHYGETAVRMAW
jgi:hypothetical protein